LRHYREKNKTSRTNRPGSRPRRQSPASINKKGFQSQFYPGNKLSLRTLFFYGRTERLHHKNGSI
jgi:hypothetical protein